MESKLRIAVIFFFLSLLSVQTHSQTPRPHNLPRLDHQVAHFGYTLGLNTMDFTIRPSASFLNLDTVYGVEANRFIGFNISMISNLRITNNLNVRFLPGLIFGQRNLDYKIKVDGGFRRHSMMIESTFVDLPLLLKYKADRLNNFRPFIVGGTAFRIDLAAQRSIKPEERPKIRLNRMNLYYEVGVGTDFFLEYFMFAIELKASWGIFNNIVYDDTQFSQMYDRLNSRMIILSFHFEGGQIDRISSLLRR